MPPEVKPTGLVKPWLNGKPYYHSGLCRCLHCALFGGGPPPTPPVILETAYEAQRRAQNWKASQAAKGRKV